MSGADCGECVGGRATRRRVPDRRAGDAPLCKPCRTPPVSAHLKGALSTAASAVVNCLSSRGLLPSR